MKKKNPTIRYRDNTEYDTSKVKEYTPQVHEKLQCILSSCMLLIQIDFRCVSITPQGSLEDQASHSAYIFLTAASLHWHSTPALFPQVVCAHLNIRD